MVSSSSIPWHNRPAREFPAQVWLRQRYGFVVASIVWARYAPYAGPREFPAKRWLRERLRRAGG